MKQRYRLYKRKKGGRYYIHDDVTGKQESLGTDDRATATRLFHSRQEAEQQPAVNLQIARAYLAASDPQIATRNWQLVMDELVKLKKDQTQHRWQTAIKDKAFDLIRHLPILETRPEHFLRVLEAGKVSTNVYLRRIHNFALDMTWLPWPVLAKKRWPAVEFKEKRGITLAEHLAIVARENNAERRAFYKLAWYLGASQSDLAFLEAENVDWDNLSSGIMGLVMECMPIYLVLGSFAVLIWVWFSKEAKQARLVGAQLRAEQYDAAAGLLKTLCPVCGGKIKFPAQNIGQQTACPHCQKAITLRKSENLKMSCFFCQEHIEFPAHAIGMKMACPHCKMAITLKEPA